MTVALPEGEVDRRVEYLAPLLAYLRETQMLVMPLMRLVEQRAKRAKLPMNTSGRLWVTRMERGQCVIPPWLVEQCCMVLGLSVAEVMGEAWVERFGVDGRGGEEAAPTGEPHIKRVYRRASQEYFEEGDDHAA